MTNSPVSGIGFSRAAGFFFEWIESGQKTSWWP
jgi:hypothetical protein